MGIRNLRTEGDDILRKKSRTVEKFDRRLHDLLDDMQDTLTQHNGVGLAAVQVGVLRRAFIVDLEGDGEGAVEFINPQLLEESGSQRVMEGCLSYPGQWGMVTRAEKVKLKAQDRFGDWFEMEGDGLMAQALLHEYGHLDGLSFKEDATFQPLTEEEVEEITRKEEEENRRAGKRRRRRVR